MLVFSPLAGYSDVPDGRMPTSCYDGPVRVWDLSGGTELEAFNLTFAAAHMRNRIGLKNLPE